MREAATEIKLHIERLVFHVAGVRLCLSTAATNRPIAHPQGDI
jgi:hypothetical protein